MMIIFSLDHSRIVLLCDDADDFKRPSVPCPASHGSKA